MTDSWYAIKIQEEVKEMISMSTVESIRQKHRKGIVYNTDLPRRKGRFQDRKKVHRAGRFQ